MKYWEIIADNLSKAGWSLGWISALDQEGEPSGSLTRIVIVWTGVLLTIDCYRWRRVCR
jgi:hypothetical protein